jgi:integrase
MSLDKRGGVWWYDFQIRGVRVRESTGLTSKSEAAKREALRKAGFIQGERETPYKESPPKFEEFALKDFAAWSENQHRIHPSTHERYMRSVKVLARYFGQRTLDMITSAEVERFKIARSRERRKFATDGRHVTPASVNRDLAVLRIMFSLAIRLKKVKSNPVTEVKLLPEDNQYMRVISWEEEANYLAVTSQPLRDVAILILETGMRPGEVLQLRRHDPDLEAGFVRISAGKTPFARRTIPLTRRAHATLCRRISAASCDWLFPSRHDPTRPLQWLRAAHIVALREARVHPPFRLYDLRHTALTRMAMAGIDLPTLRELAGHTSIQMTMRYIHPTPEHKREAVRKLEQFSIGHLLVLRRREQSALIES